MNLSPQVFVIVIYQYPCHNYSNKMGQFQSRRCIVLMCTWTPGFPYVNHPLSHGAAGGFQRVGAPEGSAGAPGNETAHLVPRPAAFGSIGTPPLIQREKPGALIVTTQRLIAWQIDNPLQDALLIKGTFYRRITI